MADTVLTARDGDIFTVTINRPAARNAVDRDTAQALYDAFNAFNDDEALSVAILTGAAGNFCAGADLKAVSEGNGNVTTARGDMGPMGPTGPMGLSSRTPARTKGLPWPSGGGGSRRWRS